MTEDSEQPPTNKTSHSDNSKNRADHPARAQFLIERGQIGGIIVHFGTQTLCMMPDRAPDLPTVSLSSQAAPSMHWASDSQELVQTEPCAVIRHIPPRSVQSCSLGTHQCAWILL
jgi:hypothetical protein